MIVIKSENIKNSEQLLMCLNNPELALEIEYEFVKQLSDLKPLKEHAKKTFISNRRAFIEAKIYIEIERLESLLDK